MFRLVDMNIDKTSMRFVMCRKHLFFYLFLSFLFFYPSLATGVYADEGYRSEMIGKVLTDEGVVQAQERRARHIGVVERYNLGREISEEAFSAWDIDIRYDGKGLPAGQGNVSDGESLYDEKCALCHGDFGQGEGRWPVLIGGFDTLKHQGGHERPEKTLGSYWPYAPIIFDYVRRAMPYNEPQSLQDDEVYAIVAYLLYLNNLVEEEFIADKRSLSNFKMPNQDNFFLDPRPDVHNEACMSNCLNAEEMTLIEAIKGVTPDQSSGTVLDEAEISEEKKQLDEDKTALKKQYKTYCAVCHDSGVADAPVLEDDTIWKSRLDNAGGIEALIQSAMIGKGSMPPKGGAMHLSDEEFGKIVRFMVE